MVEQATTETIWLSQNKVNDLNLASPDEEIIDSTPSNQEPPLSRPGKIKHGSGPRL